MEHLSLTARPTPDPQTPRRDQIGEEPVLTLFKNLWEGVTMILKEEVTL